MQSYMVAFCILKLVDQQLTMLRPYMICKRLFVNERASKKCPDEAEMMQLLSDQAHATGDRQGRIVDDPCYNTMCKAKDVIGAVKGKPQVISEARFKAGSDPRMAYSMWIMVKAYTENLERQQIWNWDATQFIVSEQGKGKHVYNIKIEGHKDGQSASNRPLSIVGDESLDIGIKWMHMGSAAGLVIPLILLVAVDDLKDEDFEVNEIPGLSHTSAANGKGYLCFTKTRAGNAAFYNWFIQKIVVPQVTECNNCYELDGPSFVSCDGEAIVLEQVFSTETFAMLRDANIDVGKIPASCSGILQPSDVSPLFRAAKTKLRNMLLKHLVGDNPVVEKNIMKVFDNLEVKYNLSIGSGQKKKATKACIGIAHATQEVTRPRLVIAGFDDCGLCPLNSTKLMKQCYIPITPQLMTTFMNATNDHVKYFLQHGHLTELVMTQAAIPVFDADRDTPRDDSALHHERAVLLTHDATRERRQNRLNSGLQLGDLISGGKLAKADSKQLKQDAKRIQALNRQDEKKKQEKDRWNAMTPAEQQAEKQHKADLRATKKAKRSQDIEDAKARLTAAIGQKDL